MTAFFYIGTFLGIAGLTATWWYYSRRIDSIGPNWRESRTTGPENSAGDPDQRMLIDTLSDALDLPVLVNFRKSIEGLAARLAAQRITQKKAKILNTALVRLNEAVDSADRRATNNADFDLHYTIVKLSENQPLISQYEVLEPHIRLYMMLTIKFHKHMNGISDRHLELVNAVIQGNAELAENYAKEHNAVDGQKLINIVDVLSDIPYETAKDILPAQCFELEGKITEDEKKQFYLDIGSLKEMNMRERDKTLFLGSALSRYISEDNLRSAARRVKNRKNIG